MAVESNLPRESVDALVGRKIRKLFFYARSLGVFLIDVAAELWRRALS